MKQISPHSLKTKGRKVYWLLKSEPSTYSIDDLARAKGCIGQWEGVRNYQARNYLRDDIQKGDFAFFYHSSCKIPAIVGIVEVVRAGYPDCTAWDPHSPYYDPKSTPENPGWFRVDVKLRLTLTQPLTLGELKNHPALSNFTLLRKGNRLSVMPVSSKEWDIILTLLDTDK